MFQLVIAVYGYVMATGIDGFIFIFVVLFKSLVNSENKPLPIGVSSSLDSIPDGTNARC
jgi:hypothetical protein